MTRAWKILFVVVDLALVAYWVAIATGLLPEEWRFRDYSNPVVQAWNWSFLPLDVLAVATGLVGVYLTSAGHPAGRLVLTVGLTLTFCAGFMAIAFWWIRGDFDVAWWAPNVLLMAVPLGVFVGLLPEHGSISPPAR